MEVINKKHNAISVNKSTGVKSFIKFHTERHIYFSITAVKELGLQPGLFMHVVNDDDKWFVYFNDDPDGFQLFQRPGYNTVDIFNMSLINLFIKRTSHNIPCKFQLQETNIKYSGHRLVELIHNKPL